jgi:hypothetical protein
MTFVDPAYHFICSTLGHRRTPNTPVSRDRRGMPLEQNMAESTLMQNSVVILVLGCLNDSKKSSDAIMQNSIC